LEQDFLSKLPFHILKDMDSASVTMKSVAQILSEWSFLIALQQKVFYYHGSDTGDQ
jgi:hypothetical protein